MYFTQEDYKKIEAWLYQRTVKDTELPSADPMNGTEAIPIIQDNRNKTIGLNDFVRQVADMKLPDFYNVTVNSKKSYLTLEEAISLVPVEQRKLGLTITYHNENGNWLMYQFKGTSLNQWDSTNYWSSLIQEAIEEFALYPDEEDITGIRDGNRTFLKFKNRDYNPEEFSGMGMIILRKNLAGTEACSIDDEDHLSNILTQDKINQENTVYIVQYDFDLDGKTISIPKNCTLWFQGGSINNGTMYLQETAILGAFEFADMGNAKLFGKFNTGQIMTFSDDSYKAKTGGYFVASTKASSATVAEDAMNERETFYNRNLNAYTTETRQELRWWNGKEWVRILDIVDYNEIKSIINDLIEKHNAEMSACYKYFKTRCYALELRMCDAEVKLGTYKDKITKCEGDIGNVEEEIGDVKQAITGIDSNIASINQRISSLQNTINNLDHIIENNIRQFIENNVVGVASVTVNGQKLTPDSNGNITLPDYPELGGIADGVKGTLTVKSSEGTTLTTYNGSTNKTLTLPTTAKKLLTVNQGSTTLGTYDGTTAKTITIPESKAFSPKTLTIQGQNSNSKITYNATEDKTLKVGSILFKQNSGNLLYDAVSGNQTEVDLKPYQNGSLRNPIILYAAEFQRNNYKSYYNRNWSTTAAYLHPGIASTTITRDDCLLTVKLNSLDNWIIHMGVAVASMSENSAETYNATSARNHRSDGGLMQVKCDFLYNKIYLRSWRTANAHSDSVNDDMMGEGKNQLLRFTLVAVGYMSVYIK